MFEFIQTVLAIGIISVSPFLIVADNAGWESLFGEDEK